MDKRLTLICGDALEELKKIPSKSIKLVFKDVKLKTNISIIKRNILITFLIINNHYIIQIF